MAEIQYPTEIPWTLFSVSGDMMDTVMADRQFPLKWKSSLALFYYEPNLDESALLGRKIVYLKAVCSITGYQVDDNELGVDIASPKEWDSRVYENFHALIRDYYPCYGALLHVAVFPFSKKPELDRFPHIIDFEPKKREMFDVVTETGQVMSRSIHALKINTGGTTTSSLETTNVDKGWSFGLEASAGKDSPSGKLALGSTYEQGYTAATGGQNVNLRQIDASKEASETMSHTTQLQQMYQLLDSYHLGTNRALFVVFPRPHIVDQALSVTNGPRRLEGIQEFFLVVSMPTDSLGLCVAAQLETSHLHETTTTETTGTTEYETGQIEQRIHDSYKGGVFSNYTKRSYPIPVPGGYIVDRSRGSGGYMETVRHGDDVTEDIDTHQVIVYDDKIVVEVTYDPGPAPDTAYFTADYTVYYRSPEPISEPVTTTVTEVDLFMTGRCLQSCLNFRTHEIINHIPRWKHEWMVWEEPLPKRHVAALAKIARRDWIADRADRLKFDVNDLQSHIRDRSLASVNSLKRYPAGQHTILDTDFGLRFLAAAPDRKRFKASLGAASIRVDAALLKKMDKKTARDMKQLTKGDLLRAPSSSLARRTGLDLEQILKLKKANLGIPERKMRTGA